MRILMLCPYPPYPPRSGGAIRIYHLLQGLARQHEVWLLTFTPNIQATHELELLHQVCRVVTVDEVPQRSLLQRGITTLTSPLPDMALRNASPAYVQAVQQLLQQHHFDVVQVESIEMAGYRKLAMTMGAGAAALPNIPLWILDEFNAEYVLQWRAAMTDFAYLRAWLTCLLPPARLPIRLLVGAPYSLVQSLKLAAYERSLLRTYDHVVVVSEDDRQALLRLQRKATLSIIPNGVDTQYFAPPTHDLGYSPTSPYPTDTASPNATLVFTGTLDFRPNIDAITWFVQQVLPIITTHRSDVQVIVVGRRPTPAVQALHTGDRVQIIGEVDDVRPMMASAAVYIVPMRMGGGIRLKLLEALAMERGVVSTTMGAEGVPELRHGSHLLLADTPRSFAAAVLLLLNTPAYRQQLGEAGGALVRDYYDWQAIVPRLLQLYAG